MRNTELEPLQKATLSIFNASEQNTNLDRLQLKTQWFCIAASIK